MSKSFFFLSLLFFTACSRQSSVSDVVNNEHNELTAPKTTPMPLDQRLENALRVANDHMEKARILGRPISSLDEAKLQGIALPLYPELPSVTWKDNLEWIADSGANAVSIVISWDQRTIQHNRITPDEDTAPTDEQVKAVIKKANALGLKVLIFPILHIKLRNEGEWRGKLAPTKIERWKESYRDYILHYAKISQESGAFALSVGSELSSLESDEVFWESIISAVRKEFKGKLTYSSNWDHYTKPKFWDKLDLIGVSSYFEVAKTNTDSIALVTQRWDTHRKKLVKFAESQNKPFILTEVGYPSIDSAATKPWDYTAKTPPNQNAQLAAFRSLSDSWTRETSSHFEGLFLWHGWGAGGKEDLSYSFWRKNTLELVEKWYGQKSK